MRMLAGLDGETQAAIDHGNLSEHVGWRQYPLALLRSLGSVMLAGCRGVEASIRSNLVIALGDMAVRWPNVLEPWTAHMYQPLTDPDTGKQLDSLLHAGILPASSAAILAADTDCLHVPPCRCSHLHVALSHLAALRQHNMASLPPAWLLSLSHSRNFAKLMPSCAC